MKTGLSAFTEKKRTTIWFALVFNLLAMTVLVLLMRPSFETNDDIVFAELGSGLRGVKDAHLVFQNYILGLIYRFLYQVTGRLPWYTIFQYAVLLAAFSGMTYVLMNRLERYWGMYLSVILLCVFGYECYIHIQFTKTAGIASAAAILLLFHVIMSDRFCVWEFLAGLLLGVFGFLYREDQFFAASALMVGIGVYFLLTLRKHYPGRALKGLGICAGCFCLLLAEVFTVGSTDAFMYRSEEWQEFKEFNNLRGGLLDYGFPDYETNRELYQELGVSEEALELYRNWNFNDPDKFTSEMMAQLISVKPERDFSIDQVWNFLKRFPGDILKQKAAYIVLLLLALWLLFGRKSTAGALALGAEALMLVGLNFYLYFQGRYMVNRVDVGLWFGVCLTVVWILAESLRDRHEKSEISGKELLKAAGRRSGRSLSAAGTVLCIIAVLGSQSFWHRDWRTATAEIPKARISQRAVLETMGTDNDHIYLAKTGTVSEIVCYGPFDPMPENLLDNVFWFGGWESRTPGIVNKMAEYGIVNPYSDMIGNEKVYLVDDNIDLTMEYIHQNYDKDAEAVFVKTLGNVDLYQVK